jgi:hypothetical protein
LKPLAAPANPRTRKHRLSLQVYIYFGVVVVVVVVGKLGVEPLSTPAGENMVLLNYLFMFKYLKGNILVGENV